MDSIIYKTINIYTESSAEKNIESLTRNHPLLAKLPIEGNALGIQRSEGDYDFEFLSYVNANEDTLKLFELDALKNGLHSKIQNFLGFTPGSILSDFNGNFIQDTSRRDLLLEALEGEGIQYYMIGWMTNLRDTIAPNSIFICGYNKEMGRVLNSELVNKY